MFKKTILCLMLLCCSSMVQAVENKTNIVILLDTSASMLEGMVSTRQTKWEAAIHALSNVASKIDPNTNVGLLIFDEDWPYPLAPVDKGKLLKAINQTSITETSGTPLGTYLKIAADRLLAEREKSMGYGVYKILVVTDGNPTNEWPLDLVDQYVPEILSRGIIVDCIGVSMPSGSVLKNKVNTYMSADDPDSLTAHVQKAVLAEVSSNDDFTEDFAEVSALPTPIVSTIIETLSNSGNHPIGEEAPVIGEDISIDTSSSSTNGNGIHPLLFGFGIFVVIFVILVVIANS